MPLFELSEPESGQGTRGFALFALGFRPFFLLAGIAAALLIPLWAAAYAGAIELAGRYGGIGWHAHEMLFGYTVAVIAGFLLTAVRNWTGRETASGWPLGALAALWLAARLLPFSAAPAWLVAGVDLLFLPALALAVGIPLVRARQPHNLVFLGLIALLTGGNLLIHAALLAGSDTWQLGIDLSVGTIVLLIVIVGGRVVPFFIERGLPGVQAPKWPQLEALVFGSALLWLATKLALPASPYLGAAAAVAALIHGVRMALWYTPRLWNVPLLWVLYLGLGWLVAGFTLDVLAGFGLVPPSLSLHAFTAGTIAVLTLGMMARVSLGHTGRAMMSARAVNWAFFLINLAALFRVGAPLLFPEGYLSWVVAASLLWTTAFLLFLVIYLPILIRPRIDGRPG